MRRHLCVATLALFAVVACSDDPVVQPDSNLSLALNASQGETDIIPGQYLVIFRDDVRNPVQVATQVAASHGLTLRHTYQHAIKGFSAVVPEGALPALQQLPFVRYIEPNKYWYIDTHERLRTSPAEPRGAFAGGFAAVRASAVSLLAAAAPFRPPANLVATTVSESQIDVRWTDRNSDEQGHELYRSDTGPNGTFAKIADLGADVESHADMGLSASTEFCYKVRAFTTNKKGRQRFTDFSNTDCATTDGGPPPPPPDPPDGRPTGLTATTIDHQQIDLAWTDGSSNEDGFSIERCQNAGCDNFAEIDQVGADVTTYMDGGLAASTPYRYRVRAFNAGGNSDYSNIAEATTDEAPPPPPPPPGCNDNGVHDDLSDPGLWGIVKVKADQNPHWQGVRGNETNPDCAMQAWFFGLDTGLDSDHPDLNVVETQTFLIGDNSGGEDGHGHGTHTAGTAAAIDGGPAGGVVGVAPGAQVYGFKVCTDGGSCPLDAIVAGVDEVTARRNDPANDGTPMVANMSLGGGVSLSIDEAVRRSVDAGVPYSLSAGNGVFGACFFPADAQNSSPARVGDDDIVGQNSNGDTKRVNGAITTTSSGQTDADVNCNFGNPVTVASPGNGIKSTWLNGGYNTISGTSMAAPHSAGAAILVLQGNGGLTPTQVEQQIVDDLDNWTTNDLPNADGRLDARCLGTGDPGCAGNN